MGRPGARAVFGGLALLSLAGLVALAAGAFERDVRPEEPGFNPDRCAAVPADLVAAIAAGLEDGLALGEATAVRSAEADAWFVAADLEGPGLEGGGDVGLWATESLTAGAGAIYAVDDAAKLFSRWFPGELTEAGLTSADDGAAEAEDCLRAALVERDG